MNESLLSLLDCLLIEPTPNGGLNISLGSSSITINPNYISLTSKMVFINSDPEIINTLSQETPPIQEHTILSPVEINETYS
jgi:hypothetical protein